MKQLFGVLMVALGIFAAGFAAGWYSRGLEQPVGGTPTAAMQMAVETESKIEAGQTATPTPPATSTAAPTRQQTTSTPTVTATPEREEWQIDCEPGDGQVKCWDVVVDENGETARLYWVGPCLDPGTLILKKQISGQLYADLQDDEWDYKFIPNKCDRSTNRPSPNHLLVRTFAGPGEYSLVFSPVGSDSNYIEFFEWPDAPAATTPTPSATTTAEPTEESTATPSGDAPELVQATTPLRGFAVSATEILHSTPGDGAVEIGKVRFASPVFVWECGSPLAHPEGAYLSLVSHEGDGEVKVGWISTMGYTGEHPCTYYSAPGVGALVNYLVATKKYGDEATIRALPGLQFDPYAGVENDLED